MRPSASAVPAPKFGEPLVTTSWIREQAGLSKKQLNKILGGRLPYGHMMSRHNYYPLDWAMRWVEEYVRERELESLEWEKAEDAPEWLIYRIAEDSWGIMHRNKVEAYAQTFEDALRFIPAPARERMREVA